MCEYRLLKSMLVGLAATVLDFVTLVVLASLIGLYLPIANIVALMVGLIVQFFANKHWAFNNHEQLSSQLVGKFILVECGAFLLNAALFWVACLITTFHYTAIKLLVGFIVYMGFSYPMWKWVFSSPSEEVS